MSSTVEVMRRLADRLEQLEKFPFGPPVEQATKRVAADAVVQLCGGDKDKARTLYKLIMQDCGGYFPQSAGVALIRATSTNLVPDVEAPPL